jgi:hypothetical protein
MKDFNPNAQVESVPASVAVMPAPAAASKTPAAPKAPITIGSLRTHDAPLSPEGYGSCSRRI